MSHRDAYALLLVVALIWAGNFPLSKLGLVELGPLTLSAARALIAKNLSGGLLDCIAAGLPTVANAHLREAMESPDFVRSVPDGLSPILIAEALMTIISDPGARARTEDASRAYYGSHNFDVYADRLMSGLGLD